MTDVTVAETLAEFVASTRFQDLSDRTIEAAREGDFRPEQIAGHPREDRAGLCARVLSGSTWLLQCTVGNAQNVSNGSMLSKGLERACEP